MDIAALRIRPTLDALRTDGVLCPAIEIFRIGFVIWISGEDLPLAIDEELIGLGARRDRSLENAVAIWCPVGLDAAPSAQDHMFAGIRSVYDRSAFCARVFRREHNCFWQVIGASAEVDGQLSWCLLLKFPGRSLRRVECPEGFRSCTRVSVITISADKDGAVYVAESSRSGNAGTYGVGILQALAQIDNCPCGGIDKCPSIHSISVLTTFKSELP